MGGSVRLPASFCGIVGLKPSFGRIPFDILPSQFDTFCHFGPLARTVADAALFLAVTMGPDDRDFSSLPMVDDIHVPPNDDVRGLRIALSLDLGYYAVDDEIVANTRHAADALRALGAHVEEVEIPLGPRQAALGSIPDFPARFTSRQSGGVHHLPEECRRRHRSIRTGDH